MTNCRLFLASALSLPLLASSLYAQKWITPTPEELSMTSIPQVPGAAAVYLNKEQTTDDGLHMFSFYVRLKVLNERGKDYANVELPFDAGVGGTRIDEISGRTVHPDGSVVPFTDKPYEKLIVKTGGFQHKAKVFTLPAVDVGSIIEYRYKLRLDDQYFMSPDWMIQSDLYTRKAHYMWRPTNALIELENGEVVQSSVAWMPILPEGAKIVQSELHNSIATTSSSPTMQLDLDVHDIPPLPTEEYMPPIQSVSYRVLFYYTNARSPADFWKNAGKQWSKKRDKFIGPNGGVKAFAATLVSPADTQDQKARKLYAAVMQFENTDFTREHTGNEDKSEGLRQINSTDDVLARKRGSGDQLAMLFIAMCRAVGLKAYAMGVADRDERVFLVGLLNINQLDDDIAIVNIEGKDVYFDPGQRYCAPEQLSWRHSFTGGLRQTDAGTELVGTPAASYKNSRTGRIADLVLDEQGVATGTVTLTYTGDPALRLRQKALTGDDTSLNEDLRTTLEQMLPAGTEVHVTSVDALVDPEKPLTVHYSVKGPIGSSTGKRLLIPADIFVMNEKPRFPETKRKVAVDLHYPSVIQDAVRIKYPSTFVVESSPVPEKQMLNDVASFEVLVKTAPNAIAVYRNLVNGRTIFTPNTYDELRGFYTKVETKDQETLVFTHAAPGTSPAATNPATNPPTRPSGN